MEYFSAIKRNKLSKKKILKEDPRDLSTTTRRGYWETGLET